MFEIHINDTNVTSGTLNVSWCLTQDTLDVLQQYNITNPIVVFCIISKDTNQSHKEYRKIVPLKDMIAYLDLRTSGENLIYAFICDDRESTKPRFLNKNFENQYMFQVIHKEKYIYKTALITNIPSDYNEDVYNEDLNKLFAETISINVPKECFAKEPAEWEKNWVNHFFRNKSVDQCSFRRRRLFAYTVQLFLLVPVFLLVRMFLLVLSLLFGLRDGMTLKYLLHPFTYTLECIWSDTWHNGTYFIRRTENNNLMNYIILPFIPIMFIPYVFLCITGLIVPVFVMLLGVIIGIFLLWFLFSGVIKDIFNHLKYKLLNSSKIELNNEDMQFILCDGTNTTKTLSDLPKSRRTIKLRFENLKSKVCRPFSL